MEKLIQIYVSKYSVVCLRQYEANDQPVLDIFDSLGCPAGSISTCIPSHLFENGETAISTDVPQQDTIDELVRIGAVEATDKIAYSAHGEYPVVKVLNLGASC